MPDLLYLFKTYDNGLLELIAGAWGIDFSETAAEPLSDQLASGLLAHAGDGSLTAALPDPAVEALQKLATEGGRLTIASFVRLYGDIRPMGAGKRRRERPDQNPASIAEVLWYTGLIGKAFLDAGHGLEEFFFIPDDLLPYIPRPADDIQPLYGSLTPANASLQVRPSGDRILDDSCTLLAALRMRLKPDGFPSNKSFIPSDILAALLKACGLLDENDIPIPEATREFLEAPRAASLIFLVDKWRQNRDFNELLLLPSLSFEGQIQNDPLGTRERILDFLAHTPSTGWIDLDSFIDDIHENQADFQRPAGDYDSWYIRSKKDQTFLRGFSNWDKVEGSLLRFFIAGILHWLGIVDLAFQQGNKRPTAFRFSAWAEDILAGRQPADLKDQPKPLIVLSNGQINVPRSCPRTVRYQVARACEWLSTGVDEYRYRLTPESLERAAGQGLKVSYLVSILKRHHHGPLPPNILRALEHWDRDGLQARLKSVEILEIDREEIMRELRKSSASSHILEAISPTSAIIRPGSRNRIMKVLLEMGYLSSGARGETGTEEDAGK